MTVFVGKRSARPRHTFYTYVRLYESETLQDLHEESWYNTRVWFLLDTAFDDIKSLQVVREECASAASAKQKNQNKIIGSSEKIDRAKMGHECDMIVRERKEKHEYVYEYCMEETKPRHKSTSTIDERAIKLPKSMKDMLYALMDYHHGDHTDLSVFGAQHTGLTITFLAADRPSPYVTRINHVASKQISSNVSLFGRTVLPVVVLVWQIKQQIIRMKDRLLANQASQLRQGSEWLQRGLDLEPEIVIPTTSTSSEFVNKKRKTNKQ